MTVGGCSLYLAARQSPEVALPVNTILFRLQDGLYFVPSLVLQQEDVSWTVSAEVMGAARVLSPGCSSRR